MPDEIGLSTQLWTRKTVLKMIKKVYKVNYVLPTISKLLNGNNLTPQKPIYRATQRNEVRIEDWLHIKHHQNQRNFLLLENYGAKKKDKILKWK